MRWVQADDLRRPRRRTLQTIAVTEPRERRVLVRRHEVHDRPQVTGMVGYRCPGQRPTVPCVAGGGLQRSGLLRLRVLRTVRLVGDHHIKGDLVQRPRHLLLVREGDRPVAGEAAVPTETLPVDNESTIGVSSKLLTPLGGSPPDDGRLHLRPLAEFLRPLVFHRVRAHDQVTGARSVLQGTGRLHRLAGAHLVSEEHLFLYSQESGAVHLKRVQAGAAVNDAVDASVFDL